MEDHNTDRTRLVANTAGSDFTPQSYDIASEDQELASQIASFDPLSAPSPVKLTGGGAFKAPERFTVAILSPDQQAPIKAQLAAVPVEQRGQREHQLVTAALKQNSVELRIKAGPGEGANAFQQERFQLAREIHELGVQEAAIYQQLAEVERWEPVFDEISGERVIDRNTGQQMVKAVEVIRGPRRTAMEVRAKELAYQAELLQGVEGDRREQKALKEAVETHKRQQQQLADEQEARRRGDEAIREERINARAEAYAKNRRSPL